MASIGWEVMVLWTSTLDAHQPVKGWEMSRRGFPSLCWKDDDKSWMTLTL